MTEPRSLSLAGTDRAAWFWKTAPPGMEGLNGDGRPEGGSTESARLNRAACGAAGRSPVL